MKKVRKQELVDLIARLYCDYIELMPLDDIADGNHGITIDVNSICIYVMDENPFDTVTRRDSKMTCFAKQIEAITFGNLKVTRQNCKIEGNSHLSWMYIANAYEVEE